MVKVHFYNGAKSLSAWDETSSDFIDDWKPESRDFVCAAVQVTYCKHIKMFWDNNSGPEDAEMLDFWRVNDLWVVDGIYFGDVTISQT